MEKQTSLPAINLDDVLVAIAHVYEELDSEIRSIGPICELSAKCCKFREYGHDLFLSGLELSFWMKTGEVAVNRNWVPGENCPWQAETGRCEARHGRPLGCRVYYCDPEFGNIMPDITEKYLRKLKEITVQAGMVWDYRPLHSHLNEALEQGHWKVPDWASGEGVACTTGDTRISMESRTSGRFKIQD